VVDILFTTVKLYSIQCILSWFCPPNYRYMATANNGRRGPVNPHSII